MSDIEQKCRVALLALSDWAVTYAPDMCDPETVEKAKARILENGTLAYVANATDQLHAAIQLLSEAETRERETLTHLSKLAKKEAEELMDKWISDQGATIETKAAGVASHIVNDFRGHIEAALIKLERQAALERGEG